MGTKPPPPPPACACPGGAGGASSHPGFDLNLSFSLSRPCPQVVQKEKKADLLVMTIA